MNQINKGLAILNELVEAKITLATHEQIATNLNLKGIYSYRNLPWTASAILQQLKRLRNPITYKDSSIVRDAVMLLSAGLLNKQDYLLLTMNKKEMKYV